MCGGVAGSSDGGGGEEAVSSVMGTARETEEQRWGRAEVGDSQVGGRTGRGPQKRVPSYKIERRFHCLLDPFNSQGQDMCKEDAKESILKENL